MSFPLHCCGPKVATLPIEALFIIISTALGIVTELSAGFHRTGGHTLFFMGENSLQHVATYTMFFIVGIIGLLIHCRAPIPKHLDIAAVNLAFSAEALSFYFHGHTRSLVEIQLHVLLALAICSTVVCNIFEMAQRENQIYATLLRAYCTFIQGSWFFTIGFFLYSPYHAHYGEIKDPDEHQTSMLISYYFVVHMAIGLFVSILLSLPAYYISKCNRQSIDFAGYEYTTFVNNDDDDENIADGHHTHK